MVAAGVGPPLVWLNSLRVARGTRYFACALYGTLTSCRATQPNDLGVSPPSKHRPRNAKALAAAFPVRHHLPIEGLETHERGLCDCLSVCRTLTSGSISRLLDRQLVFFIQCLALRAASSSHLVRFAQVAAAQQNCGASTTDPRHCRRPIAGSGSTRRRTDAGHGACRSSTWRSSSAGSCCFPCRHPSRHFAIGGHGSRAASTCAPHSVSASNTADCPTHSNRMQLICLKNQRVSGDCGHPNPIITDAAQPQSTMPR